MGRRGERRRSRHYADNDEVIENWRATLDESDYYALAATL
jgi:hypothetical protein